MSVNNDSKVRRVFPSLEEFNCRLPSTYSLILCTEEVEAVGLKAVFALFDCEPCSVKDSVCRASTIEGVMSQMVVIMGTRFMEKYFSDNLYPNSWNYGTLKQSVKRG
jgi:hypothetical protein